MANTPIRKLEPLGGEFESMSEVEWGSYLSLDEVLDRLLRIQSNKDAPGVAFFQLNKLIEELS